MRAAAFHVHAPPLLKTPGSRACPRSWKRASHLQHDFDTMEHRLYLGGKYLHSMPIGAFNTADVANEPSPPLPSQRMSTAQDSSAGTDRAVNCAYLCGGLLSRGEK